MTEQEEFVLEYLREQYCARNKFYNFLGIRIEQAYNGRARQSLLAEPDSHANLYANLHGGVLLSMGDSCMGVACASLGKMVVTLDTHTNFVANVNLPAKIICDAQVVHNGHKTIVMEATVSDEEGRILGRLRSTYYVIGVFEEIAARLPQRMY